MEETNTAPKQTREAWLETAVEYLRALFGAADLTLPPLIRVSCSWPSRGGLSKSRRVMGQCFDAACSTGGVTEIFISPLLREVNGEDGKGVLPVLVHELVHAAIGCDAGHGPEFKAAAKDVGLVGKPTSTSAGESLRAKLALIAETLGDYPHYKLVPTEKQKTPASAKNRQRKITCPRLDLHETKEPYILRGSRKVIQMGLPNCPVCGETLVAEEEKEDVGSNGESPEN